MPKYKVDVCYTTTEILEDIEVEADTPEEAGYKALKRAIATDQRRFLTTEDYWNATVNDGECLHEIGYDSSEIAKVTMPKIPFNEKRDDAITLLKQVKAIFSERKIPLVIHTTRLINCVKALRRQR